jgi:SCP1.201-like deaminase
VAAATATHFDGALLTLLATAALALVATVLAGTSLTETAQAESCPDVEVPGPDGGTASSIETFNVTCEQATGMLERWIPDGFPQNQFDWFCAEQSEKEMLCSGGNGGGAPYFTFELWQESPEGGGPQGFAPGSFEVIPPPGPVTVAERLRPWTRFGMSEQQWRAMESSFVDQACDAWLPTIFGCTVVGLTLDSSGKVVPLEECAWRWQGPPDCAEPKVQQGGVGSAISRAITRLGGSSLATRLASLVGQVGATLPNSIRTQLMAWRALPSPARWLPVYPGKGPTSGTFMAGTTELGLVSGVNGPAQGIPLKTLGFNGYFRRHVEGHAAAYMRQNGIRDATVFINRLTPCEGTCLKVINSAGGWPRIRVALPKGYTLRVVTSDGKVWIFKGVS